MRPSNPLPPILICSQSIGLPHTALIGCDRHRASPRTLTAQAKKADNESRKRRIDDSASPRRVRGDQGSRHLAIGHRRDLSAASAVGVRRGSAASAVYVLAETECRRPSSQIGSKVRTVARPARGSTPPARAVRSRLYLACASRLVSKALPATYVRPSTQRTSGPKP